MGAERLGYAKYNFWGQNDIILTFLRLNDVVLAIRNFFFLNFKTLIETTLFQFIWDQNGVILVLFSFIQNDAVWISVQTNVVLICIKNK